MKKYFKHFVETYKNLALELETEFNNKNSHVDFKVQNELFLEKIEIELNNIVKKLKDNTFTEPEIKLTGHDTFSSFSIIEKHEKKTEDLKIDYFHFIVDKILRDGLPYYAFELDNVYVKKQQLDTELETLINLTTESINICIDSHVNSQFLDFSIIFIGENKFHPMYNEFKDDNCILNENYEKSREVIKSLYQIAQHQPERVFDFLFKKLLFTPNEKDEISILYDINIDLISQEKYTLDIYKK